MSATPLIKVRLTPEDGSGPFNVECVSRDVLIWERTGRANSYADLMRRQNMADLYRIAHIACRRLGLYDGDLATFEQTIDLEPIPDDDEGEGEGGGGTGPTRPAP